MLKLVPDPPSFFLFQSDRPWVPMGFKTPQKGDLCLALTDVFAGKHAPTGLPLYSDSPLNL